MNAARRKVAAPRGARWLGVGLATALASALMLLPAFAVPGPARAVALVPAADANATTPLTGAVHGPGFLGKGLHGTFVVTANGGPAVAPNGTQTGIFSYKATLSGTNTTGGLVTPLSGVLVNRSASLSVTAPNVTQTVTLAVLVTSSVHGTGTKNVSSNFTATFQVVQPYHLAATLSVPGPEGSDPFSVTVTLDGTPVGSVSVPSLAAGSTYPLGFDYVTGGLSPGWHTFSINLAPEHGLVVFAGGQQEFSQSFYVQAPAANLTVWYVAGVLAFIAAIFIWLMAVGARRRGRRR